MGRIQKTKAIKDMKAKKKKMKEAMAETTSLAMKSKSPMKKAMKVQATDPAAPATKKIKEVTSTEDRNYIDGKFHINGIYWRDVSPCYIDSEGEEYSFNLNNPRIQSSLWGWQLDVRTSDDESEEEWRGKKEQATNSASTAMKTMNK